MTMTQQFDISAPIGEGDKNRPEDVRLIQESLSRVQPAVMALTASAAVMNTQKKDRSTTAQYLRRN